MPPAPPSLNLGLCTAGRLDPLAVKPSVLLENRVAVSCLCTAKSGHGFRVGTFLDFVGRTTRTEGPHGVYARRAKRNRMDHRRGEIERLGTRTSAA